MRILIAGGGTGGHVYPALAVARSLRARRDGTDLRWVGGHRGLEGRIVGAAGIPFDRLLLRSLRTVDRSVAAAVDPVRLALSFPQALALLARWRPDAIFTTGGYISLPVVGAAAVLRIPALLWEGNVELGRSARVAARLTRCRAVTYAETARTLRDPTYVTGTPIRDLAHVDRVAARERFEIPGDARCLLIFGGSQAVRRFDQAIDAALPELARRAIVLHVAGPSSMAAAEARRAALPEGLRPRYRPYPFLNDEMTDALAAADLVVGRAGASTLAEVTALGTPAVIVPYPHAAGHQGGNARVLADAGAGTVIPDDAFDGPALLAAAEVLAEPRRHVAMSAASRSLARPGAADAVAELLLALAERRALPARDAIDRLSRKGPA
jgi:UDP-N-acetylglucosamine--N-acetylmuramyl-(pentapeptide) pyrophosphoryl-undecaprenol N-acetylglucosamine transferase